MTLVEQLGFDTDAKLLIVSCDDLGSSHAANVGVYEALREGLATSAGLMVPCPWAREAAARYRGEDIGVHLTLNAEWDVYRWGPITRAPSLLDGDGGFPRTVEDMWDHADLDEVDKELRAQVERAILWGFDVSHLDSHLGALERRPEFFDIYIGLACDFGLPIRLPDRAAEREIGFPFRDLATEAGVLYPDAVIRLRGRAIRGALEKALFDAAPGVTEVHAHPAVDAPELRALSHDWASRVDDHDGLVNDHDLRSLAARAGVQLIGYRRLREAMRQTTAHRGSSEGDTAP